MSVRFELVNGHFLRGFWNEIRVRNAVAKKWITAEEFQQITGKKY